MSTATIHPRAFVDPTAEISEGSNVGAFAYVGPGARIGADCDIRAHAVIEGPGVTLGDRNIVWGGAVIGGAPQDVSYHGELVTCVIGSDNEFRENVTVHRGTKKGGGITRIGSGNLLMVGAHVAHDCDVGSHTILSNNVMLAGHVVIEDRAIMSGGSAMHHFGTVGTMAYIGGLSRLLRDAPPYMVTEGNPPRVAKVNSIGLQRNGLADDSIRTLQTAFRYLFRRRHATWQDAFAALDQDGVRSSEIERLRTFFVDVAHGKKGRAREADRDGGNGHAPTSDSGTSSV